MFEPADTAHRDTHGRSWEDGLSLVKTCGGWGCDIRLVILALISVSGKSISLDNKHDLIIMSVYMG